MSTTRGPWRVSPRERRHNGRIESCATKKTNAARGKPLATAPVRREANLLNDDFRANPDISVTDELDSADAAVISDGLRAYYLSQTGYYDFRPLAVFVRDPQTGKIIGGLHGRSEFGLVYVAWFFLPED